MLTTELTLYKQHLRNIPLYLPGVGSVVSHYQIITAIQAGQSTILPMRYFDWEDRFGPGETMEPEVIGLHDKLAKRIVAFYEATFVQGKSGFNCFSFMNYVMGWSKSVELDTKRYYTVKMVNAKETVTNKAYAVCPADPYDALHHACIGTQRAGYVLNVIGPDMPLAVNSTLDLLCMYISKEIRELTGVRHTI